MSTDCCILSVRACQPRYQHKLITLFDNLLYRHKKRPRYACGLCFSNAVGFNEDLLSRSFQTISSPSFAPTYGTEVVPNIPNHGRYQVINMRSTRSVRYNVKDSPKYTYGVRTSRLQTNLPCVAVQSTKLTTITVVVLKPTRRQMTSCLRSLIFASMH